MKNIFFSSGAFHLLNIVTVLEQENLQNEENILVVMYGTKQKELAKTLFNFTAIYEHGEEKFDNIRRIFIPHKFSMSDGITNDLLNFEISQNNTFIIDEGIFSYLEATYDKYLISPKLNIANNSKSNNINKDTLLKQIDRLSDAEEVQSLKPNSIIFLAPHFAHLDRNIFKEKVLLPFIDKYSNYNIYLKYHPRDVEFCDINIPKIENILIEPVLLKNKNNILAIVGTQSSVLANAKILFNINTFYIPSLQIDNLYIGSIENFRRIIACFSIEKKIARDVKYLKVKMFKQITNTRKKSLL